MKTSELTDVALDYAVAKAEKMADDFIKFKGRIGDSDELWSPSTDWRYAGPLIDREGIISQKAVSTYYAWLETDPEGERNPRASGATRLEAAMRLFVTEWFGEEIEIPKELL